MGRTASSAGIWISSQQDGLDHLVTLEQAGATIHAGTGVYTAICAARFVPLPMIAHPGPPVPTLPSAAPTRREDGPRPTPHRRPPSAAPNRAASSLTRCASGSTG
jgi:hypothetical protein